MVRFALVIIGATLVPSTLGGFTDWQRRPLEALPSAGVAPWGRRYLGMRPIRSAAPWDSHWKHRLLEAHAKQVPPLGSAMPWKRQPLEILPPRFITGGVTQWGWKEPARKDLHRVRASSQSSTLQSCPGAGAPGSEQTCEKGVCAQLLGSDGTPLNWGKKGNFWEVTEQTSFMWDDTIRSNGGDSWCIPLRTATVLIWQNGCENVHIRCDGTDVGYVLALFSGNCLKDYGFPPEWLKELEPTRDCLKKKCVPDVSLSSQTGSFISSPNDSVWNEGSVIGLAVSASAGCVMCVLMATSLTIWRRKPPVFVEPVLG